MAEKFLDATGANALIGEAKARIEAAKGLEYRKIIEMPYAYGGATKAVTFPTPTSGRYALLIKISGLMVAESTYTNGAWTGAIDTSQPFEGTFSAPGNSSTAIYTMNKSLGHTGTSGSVTMTTAIGCYCASNTIYCRWLYDNYTTGEISTTAPYVTITRSNGSFTLRGYNYTPSDNYRYYIRNAIIVMDVIPAAYTIA